MIITLTINTTDAAHYIADVQQAVNAIIASANELGWDEEAIKSYIKILAK